jgi:nucleoside-diphosphate-sugar epimerase
MRALVTGAAGFIGSTLVERLLGDGWDVRGVDAFTPYYDVATKWRNVRVALDCDRYQLLELDLLTADLAHVLDGVDVIFHQAGQPGVRLSWDSGFATYAEANVLVTQRLLEAARRSDVRRVVYASSSSVYGNADTYPVREDVLPRPHSPYGVTKLAAEHMCGLFAANYGLPVVSLRYFTVYGPRQRPDMAIHRLIEAAIDGTEFPLYGDGSHVRDFTYVDDVVEANLAAATAWVEPGTVVNVCAGGSTRMSDLIEAVELAVGPINLNQLPEQAGDVQRTGGDPGLAGMLLDWSPRVQLVDGVARQVDWHRASRVGT